MTKEEKTAIMQMVFYVHDHGDTPLKKVLNAVQEETGLPLDELVGLRKSATKAGYLKSYQGEKRRWYLGIGDVEIKEIWEEKETSATLPDEGPGVVLSQRPTYDQFRVVNQWMKKRGMILAYVEPGLDVFVRPKGSKEKPVKLEEVVL